MDPQRVRIYQIEALVLHQQDYAEADRILTLLTPQGKLRAVAKGIRRPISHRAGHLDLFMRVGLQLAKGRNLDIITQAECLENFGELSSDVLRFTYACYVCELVEYLAQEEEQHPIYDLAINTLRHINDGTELELWVRYFELTLLRYAGYQPELYRCVHCGSEITAVVNYLSLDHGGLLCPNCAVPQARQVSVHAQKLLRFLQRSDQSEVGRLTVAPATRNEVEDLMLSYLQHTLEREIKSATMLRRLSHDNTFQKL
jgi:DNA repair protein RecO (recombination protein O)